MCESASSHHVNCSCREGTGDMRAAQLLTWSFEGSFSPFSHRNPRPAASLSLLSLPGPCKPASLPVHVTALPFRKQPRCQQAFFLLVEIGRVGMHGDSPERPGARTRSAGVRGAVPAGWLALRLISVPPRSFLRVTVLYFLYSSWHGVCTCIICFSWCVVHSIASCMYVRVQYMASNGWTDLDLC